MLKKLLAGMFQPELDRLKAEYEQKMKAQAAEHEQASQVLRQELTQARQESQALQSLQQQLQQLEADKQQLQSQMQTQHAQAVQDKQVLEQQIASLQSELDALRSSSQSDAATQHAAQDRLSALEAEKVALQQQLQQSQAAVEALENEKTMLKLRAQMQHQEAPKAEASPAVAANDSLIRPPQRSKKKVLIVDDAATTRILQKNMLESAGYEVVMGNDGQQGQSLLTEHLPDLVITDIEMPRMNGFELTTWIKQSPYREVPVLLVTSHSDEAFQTKGLQAGANGFVEKKSFNQKTFLEIIQHYV